MNLGDRMVMRQAVKMLTTVKGAISLTEEDEITGRIDAVISTLEDRIAMEVSEGHDRDEVS